MAPRQMFLSRNGAPVNRAGLSFFGALGWIELWGPIPPPFPPSTPNLIGAPEKGPSLLQFWRCRGKSGLGSILPPLAGITVNFSLVTSRPIYFKLIQHYRNIMTLVVRGVDTYGTGATYPPIWGTRSRMSPDI